MRGAARAIVDKTLEAIRYLLKIAISMLLILHCRVEKDSEVLRCKLCLLKFKVVVTIHLDESQDCDVFSVL